MAPVIDVGNAPYVALVTGTSAVIIWAAVFARSVRAYRRGNERRHWVVMPTTALLASLGTLASAIGYAMQRGVVVIDVNPEVLSMVASMGRGALLMAGIIVLAYYAPPHKP